MFIKTLFSLALASFLSTAHASPDLLYKFEWREKINSQSKTLNQFRVLTAGHIVGRYSSITSIPYNSTCEIGTPNVTTSHFAAGPQLQLITLGLETGNKVITDIDYEFTEVKDKYRPFNECSLEYLKIFSLKGKLQVTTELNKETTVVESQMSDGRELSLIMMVSQSSQ